MFCSRSLPRATRNLLNPGSVLFPYTCLLPFSSAATAGGQERSGAHGGNGDLGSYTPAWAEAGVEPFPVGLRDKRIPQCALSSKMRRTILEVCDPKLLSWGSLSPGERFPEGHRQVDDLEAFR